MKKKRNSKNGNQKREGSGSSKASDAFRTIFKSRIFRESAGIFLISACVFLLIGYASFGSNGKDFFSRCGRIGTIIVQFLLQYLGIVSLLIPIMLGIVGVVLFRYRQIEKKRWRLLGFVVFLISASAFASHLAPRNLLWHGYKFSAGGSFGNRLIDPMCKYLDKTGTTIVLTCILLITVLSFTGWSYNRFLSWLFDRICTISIRFWNALVSCNRAIALRRKTRKAIREERIKLKKQESVRRVVTEQEIFKTTPVFPVRDDFSDDDDDDIVIPLVIQQPPPAISTYEHARIPGEKAENSKVSVLEEEENTSETLQASLSEPPITRPIKDIRREDRLEAPITRSMEYQHPDINILDDPPGEVERESHEELLQKSDMLISKLREFSIDGRITEVCPGPVITRYEFEPAPGIKISKIIGLSDDLALGMRSKFGLRVSPIPGKSTLGVEIPNQYRETVYLKDILISEDFQKAQKKSILSLPLGKDTAGRPYISDLKRMPHLLIAGATGSGKSVCINTILTGLLYVTKPTELRLLLIDPKMLELSDFNSIPHLREPVITDTKQAPDALNWAVSEMERRYRLLAKNGVRNIDQYNAKVSHPEYEGEGEPLPFLVIVIDELADLMLTAAATIEDTIQRLAQMARAAGIHLIIATQRPSVDVITGVIKANLPCRLAFQVASKVDSRTILDTIGAEKLIGMGDCIFVPPGTSQMIRVHGAYVSDSEVKRLVKHLALQPGPVENEESIFETLGPIGDNLDAVDDPMYDEAVKLVLSTGVASISMLQRRLKVGHSRASRLIDFMELSGIVGPHIGSKTREILVDPEEYIGRMNEMAETDEYE